MGVINPDRYKVHINVGEIYTQKPYGVDMHRLKEGTRVLLVDTKEVPTRGTVVLLEPLSKMTKPPHFVVRWDGSNQDVEYNQADLDQYRIITEDSIQMTRAHEMTEDDPEPSIDQTHAISIIKPRVEFMSSLEYEPILLFIERCARTCYKSEEKITPGSAEKLIRNTIIKSGHESVLEHIQLTVRVICDRSTSHQWVRHRIGVAYSQESQRYCNYNKRGELEVVCPPDIANDPKLFEYWCKKREDMYEEYKYYLRHKIKAEDARSCLANAVKTEFVTTKNIRAWRNFAKLRTTPHAQWQIRGIARNIITVFQRKLPVFFEDITWQN